MDQSGKGDAVGKNEGLCMLPAFLRLFTGVLHQQRLEMNAQNIYKFAFLTTKHASCQMNACAAITKRRSTRTILDFLAQRRP